MSNTNMSPERIGMSKRKRLPDGTVCPLGAGADELFLGQETAEQKEWRRLRDQWLLDNPNAQ
jgi:asparagine synthetase B (glutamine-hydrolysing)